MNALIEHLEHTGLIKAQQALEAKASSHEKAQSVCQWLLENADCCQKQLASALARYFHLPLLDLNAIAIQRSPIELVDEKLIRSNQCLPLWQRSNMLFVAISDPEQKDLLADIKFHTGKQVELVVVEHQLLLTKIDEVLRESASSDYVDQALHDEAKSNTQVQATSSKIDDELDDKPLVRFINRLLGDAVRIKVSDIHFEPYENYYRVRFRRDGQLLEIARPPLAMAGRIATRLKVMAQLDISERRLPQDGRIRWRSAAEDWRTGSGIPVKTAENRNASVDFRISVLPTLWGEKLVLRNLDSSHRLLEPEGLGFEQEQLLQFRNALHKNQGLILVTGPTGSGKTQTLYTGIQELNRSDRNIATAEDPVEFNIDGINQVAVNNKSGLSFARILRAFLRQDPDILMVGEVRDSETAEIAIKAAQTGHLVLATLHCNSALAALDRLSSMGIPAYNLAAASSLFMAQRLVRKLCRYCKQAIKLPDKILLDQGFTQQSIEKIQASESLFQANGCAHCHGGYRGRVGIYEVVPVSEQLAGRIMSGASSLELSQVARNSGHLDMRQAALLKVGSGVTSLEEANRLT